MIRDVIALLHIIIESSLIQIELYTHTQKNDKHEIMCFKTIILLFFFYFVSLASHFFLLPIVDFSCYGMPHMTKMNFNDTHLFCMA